MQKIVRNLCLVVAVVVMAACGTQSETKTIVLDSNGHQVAEIKGDKTGVFVTLGGGGSIGDTIYHYQIGQGQQPATIFGDFTSEQQFIPLKAGYWYIVINAERNGVFGNAYQSFYLAPMEIKALEIVVNFQTGNLGGLDLTVVPVTSPTIYASPGAIHTTPITTRGTVISVDLTTDWDAVLNVGYLMFGSSSVSPYTLGNCELQDAVGSFVATGNVTLWSEWRDINHTVMDYYSQIDFGSFSYGLQPSVATTFQVVCDISAGNQWVDFFFSGIGLAEYQYFFLEVPISWANSVISE